MQTTISSGTAITTEIHRWIRRLHILILIDVDPNRHPCYSSILPTTWRETCVSETRHAGVRDSRLTDSYLGIGSPAIPATPESRALSTNFFTVTSTNWPEIRLKLCVHRLCNLQRVPLCLSGAAE